MIPARLASTRLPEKLLADIAGKPLICHTYERASSARTVSRVIVATDDERIASAICSIGGEAAMTSPDHMSGSDRAAEVAESLPPNSIVVNVQGDEPLISPDAIDDAVRAISGRADLDVVTTSQPIMSANEVLNANIVKVVTDSEGRALYFSRSPVPYPRDASLRYGGDLNAAIAAEPDLLGSFRKHTGLYVYRREFLLKFTRLPQTRLEKLEMLEQLRALENGASILVIDEAERSIGVDTADDLEKVRQIIASRSLRVREARDADLPEIARVHVEAWRGSFEGVVPEDYLAGLTAADRERVLRERLANRNYRLMVIEEAGRMPAFQETGRMPAFQETGRMPALQEVSGFIDYGWPDPDGLPFDARIFSFYLLPERQRNGIGTKLFSACFDALRAAGLGSVCLETIENSPFRGFYDKHGGRVIANGQAQLGGHRVPTVIYGWDSLENRS